MTVLFYFFFFFCEKQKITRAYARIYIRMYARKNKKKKKCDFRDIFAKICRFTMVRSDIFADFIIFFIFFLLEIVTFRP